MNSDELYKKIENTYYFIDIETPNKHYLLQALEILHHMSAEDKDVRFDERQKNKLNKERPKEEAYYPYIPFSVIEFYNKIFKIKAQLNRDFENFVDVGCGVGDKLLLAKEFLGFKKVTGIEYSSKTFEIAKKALKSYGDIEIINDDAFNIDFSRFDFIYLFVPISNNYIMLELVLKIFQEMPENGVFLDVGVGQYARLLEKYIENIPPYVDYETELYFTKKRGKIQSRNDSRLE